MKQQYAQRLKKFKVGFSEGHFQKYISFFKLYLYRSFQARNFTQIGSQDKAGIKNGKTAIHIRSVPILYR